MPGGKALLDCCSHVHTQVIEIGNHLLVYFFSSCGFVAQTQQYNTTNVVRFCLQSHTTRTFDTTNSHIQHAQTLSSRSFSLFSVGFELVGLRTYDPKKSNTARCKIRVTKDKQSTTYIRSRTFTYWTKRFQ